MCSMDGSGGLVSPLTQDMQSPLGGPHFPADRFFASCTARTEKLSDRLASEVTSQGPMPAFSRGLPTPDSGATGSDWTVLNFIWVVLQSIALSIGEVEVPAAHLLRGDHCTL